MDYLKLLYVYYVKVLIFINVCESFNICIYMLFFISCFFVCFYYVYSYVLCIFDRLLKMFIVCLYFYRMINVFLIWI